MRLPTILERIPRIAYVLAIPVVAFIVTVGVVLGTSGGSNNNKTALVPTVGPSGANLDVGPTSTPRVAPTTAQGPAATATVAPTAAPAEPNREDCNAIRGTPYRSDNERNWFQANCGPR